jgi:hypothetical protein
MSSLRPQDRKSLCRFTFADGRQCRALHSPDHPDFCFDHARKDSQARAADKLARELSYFFSGEYLSACDLSAALGRLLPAVVRGDIKPRSARTLAYLAQTLVQTIHLSQHEYINAFGTDSWRRAVSNSVRQNFDHRQPTQPPQPPPDQPPVVAGLSRSVRPGSTAKTGEVQSPQPSPAPQPPQQPTSTSPRPQQPASAPKPGPAPKPSTQSAQPTPSPHTPLPPTDTEFAQQLLTGLNASPPVHRPSER